MKFRHSKLRNENSHKRHLRKYNIQNNSRTFLCRWRHNSNYRSRIYPYFWLQQKCPISFSKKKMEIAHCLTNRKVGILFFEETFLEHVCLDYLPDLVRRNKYLYSFSCLKLHSSPIFQLSNFSTPHHNYPPFQNYIHHYVTLLAMNEFSLNPSKILKKRDVFKSFSHRNFFFNWIDLADTWWKFITNCYGEINTKLYLISTNSNPWKLIIT